MRLLAEVAIRLGMAGTAEIAYREALASTKKIFPRYQNIPFNRELAISMIQNGHAEFAQYALDELFYLLEGRYPLSHARDAAETAEAFADIGDFDRAVALAATAGDDSRYPTWYRQALRYVARALAQKGRMIEAARLAVAITDKVAAVQTLCDFSRILWDEENKPLSDLAINQANCIASKIADLTGRDEAYGILAVSEAAREGIQEALRYIAKINDPDVSRHAHDAVAGWRAKKGDIGGALVQLRSHSPDSFLITLAQWSSLLAALQSGLAARALCEAIRIVGWHRVDWQRVAVQPQAAG
jgi:hypothetical protein